MRKYFLAVKPPKKTSETVIADGLITAFCRLFQEDTKGSSKDFSGTANPLTANLFPEPLQCPC